MRVRRRPRQRRGGPPQPRASRRQVFASSHASRRTRFRRHRLAALPSPRHQREPRRSSILEALDSTTSERGHEPDVSVVAGGELTISAPSLSGVRRRPGFHLGSLHVDRRGRRAILNLLSPLSSASSISSRISQLIWFGVPFLRPPVLGCPLPAIVLFGSTLDSEGRFRPPSWASLLPDGGTAVMGHLCVQE